MGEKIEMYIFFKINISPFYEGVLSVLSKKLKRHEENNVELVGFMAH